MILSNGDLTMTFEIKRTFIASTAHTNHKDFDLLDKADILTEQYEYGTRVYLRGEYGSESGAGSILDRISKFSFSEGLKLLVLFAVSSNCSWLELDSDGPIYEEFPEYEW
jgi:hypothetical protein